MLRILRTAPPDDLMRLRNGRFGRQLPVPRWVPLARDFWRERRQAIGHRDHAVRAVRAATFARGPPVRCHAPYVIWSLRACPPNGLVRAVAHLVGEELAILCRVPFGEQPGIACNPILRGGRAQARRARFGSGLRQLAAQHNRSQLPHRATGWISHACTLQRAGDVTQLTPDDSGKRLKTSRSTSRDQGSGHRTIDSTGTGAHGLLWGSVARPPLGARPAFEVSATAPGTDFARPLLAISTSPL